MDITIDATGKPCPQPLVMTKKALDSIQSGRVITLVDNDVASQNVVKLAKSLGFSYTVEQRGGEYRIIIDKTPTADRQSRDQLEAPVDLPDGEYCILITKKTMGEGSETLGALLLRSFFTALKEAPKLPSGLFFLNGGVYLTTQGSECADLLLELSQKGVSILSCGTCLDYFNLKDKLIVGEITNMYDIVDTTTRLRTITL
jgi:selenium metabolism protein YedF